MLALRAITKSFAGRRAVGPISLTLRPGEITALLGPSGCGKSTLLRLAIGLLAPEEGTIELDGLPLRPDTLPALRARTGYVIQEGGLFPHLSCADNVTLMARHLRWDAARIAERLAELAALVQLPKDLLDRPPRALSGGQRQRVALMRALMLGPDLLLLDEPLGALDPLIRSDLQRELRAILTSLACTVLLVTHDLTEAARLADRIVLLRDGLVVQDGPLSALRSAPAAPFVTRFLSAWETP